MLQEERKGKESSLKDIAKSIKGQLLNTAKQQGENFNTLLAHYALQRMLYRLSISEFREQFLLKGAWLFVLWNNALHRPTRDVDLLGYGDNSEEQLLAIFQKIASMAVEPADGLVFNLEGFSAEQIKKDGDYQGVRINGQAMLDSAIIPLQIDIGFGDAVTPEAQVATLPCLLDLPAPTLRVYPVYTAIAEKFQAMVHLGLLNSRIKDFYDVYVIACTQALSSNELNAAIRATFLRRNTPITDETLTVFSPTFKHDDNKQKQWQAFIRKNRLDCPLTFAELVNCIETFLNPIYQDIASNLTDAPRMNTMHWNPNTASWQLP